MPMTYRAFTENGTGSPYTGTNAIAIEAGAHFTSVLLSNGIGACGDAEYGALGGPTNTNTNHILKVPANNYNGLYINDLSAVAIASAERETHVITNEGKIYNWGRNNAFHLGDHSVRNLSSYSPGVIGLVEKARGYDQTNIRPEFIYNDISNVEITESIEGKLEISQKAIRKDNYYAYRLYGYSTGLGIPNDTLGEGYDGFHFFVKFQGIRSIFGYNAGFQDNNGKTGPEIY